MKFALLALMLAATASAQMPTAPLAQACGPESVSFKVKLDNSQHAPAPPEPGMARVYFVHDAGTYYSHPPGYPTTKIGMDGAWVGANHADSYFSVSVPPGEHHVCADLQSSLVDQRVELVHFTAEAGKVYYFRTRLLMSRSLEMLQLDAIDSDQGNYLIRSFPLSISHPKK